MGQLLEVDGRSVLGRAITERVGSELRSPLGSVGVVVPEVVLPAVSAERGVRRAWRFRAEPAAAAARVDDIREPRRQRVSEGVRRECTRVG